MGTSKSEFANLAIFLQIHIALIKMTLICSGQQLTPEMSLLDLHGSMSLPCCKTSNWLFIAKDLHHKSCKLFPKEAVFQLLVWPAAAMFIFQNLTQDNVFWTIRSSACLALFHFSFFLYTPSTITCLKRIQLRYNWISFFSEIQRSREQKSKQCKPSACRKENSVQEFQPKDPLLHPFLVMPED